MPVQEYNINTRDEVAGTLYGISYTNSDRLSARAETAIPFGVGVKPGVLPRNVVVGGDASGDLYGISLRTLGRTMQVTPGTGEISYKIGDELAFVREGTMNIQVNGAVATQMGGDVFCSTVDGKFAAAAVDANYILVENARWNSVTPAGKIGLLTLTISKQVIAP